MSNKRRAFLKYQTKNILLQTRTHYSLQTTTKVNKGRIKGNFLTKQETDSLSSLVTSTDLYLSTRTTINQAGELAITKMRTQLKQTVATSSQNGNETANSESNKLDHRSFISEISKNLFTATEERNSNENLDDKLDVMKHVCTGKISRFGEHQVKMRFLAVLRNVKASWKLFRNFGYACNSNHWNKHHKTIAPSVS